MLPATRSLTLALSIIRRPLFVLTGLPLDVSKSLRSRQRRGEVCSSKQLCFSRSLTKSPRFLSILSRIFCPESCQVSHEKGVLFIPGLLFPPHRFLPCNLTQPKCSKPGHTRGQNEKQCVSSTLTLFPEHPSPPLIENKSCHVNPWLWTRPRVGSSLPRELGEEQK